MENEALLLTLSEVSIAITGFSGVVAALSRKTWGDIERFRFINLVTFSIAATLFSVLPLAVSIYHASGFFPWIVSASLFAILVTIFQITRLVSVRKLARTPGLTSVWAGRVIVTGSGIVVVLQLIGLTNPSVIDATYISGILVIILLAIIQFVVFIMRIIVEEV
jgi:hypothetical protein